MIFNNKTISALCAKKNIKKETLINFITENEGTISVDTIFPENSNIHLIQNYDDISANIPVKIGVPIRTRKGGTIIFDQKVTAIVFSLSSINSLSIEKNNLEIISIDGFENDITNSTFDFSKCEKLANLNIQAKDSRSMPLDIYKSLPDRTGKKQGIITTNCINPPSGNINTDKNWEIY